MEQVNIIGIDLAKRSFQLHGARADGSVAFRRKVSREKLLYFLAALPRCVVAMEACASTVKLKAALRQIDPDDVNLFHGCLLLWGLVTPPPWHTAMPSGGGVHSINFVRRLTDRTIVIAVGRGDETPATFGLQVVLAHQTADLLTVDDDPLIA